MPTPTHEEAAFYANALCLESLTARKLLSRQPCQARYNVTNNGLTPGKTAGATHTAHAARA
ncbi:hypothetical protein, partial [Halomonas sp. 3A7M]|uniref:hypothetical protein n=1 Tax=Halomonas sp. 3A7M TaxID=2742616 RepID=UPI001D0063DA